MSAAASLARRELLRLRRQPSRLIATIGTPAMLWVFFASGFAGSFEPPGKGDLSYAAFFLPSAAASTEEIDIELSFKAPRKNFLAYLSKYRDLKPNKQNVLVFHDMEFDQAKAEIDYAGKRRTVGVFRTNSNFGQIDVSSDVECDRDGHPKLNSIREEVQELSKSF